MPPQQVTTGPTPIEGVKRINIVVVRSQGQRQGIGLLRRDSYTMDTDRKRNCYTCRGFRHMV